jgi:hypothetical protein
LWIDRALPNEEIESHIVDRASIEILHCTLLDEYLCSSNVAGSGKNELASPKKQISNARAASTQRRCQPIALSVQT